MASDTRLQTPQKLPSSPMRWHSVDRDLKVETLSPMATTRRRVVYTWRIIREDGSHEDYTGKTIQPLTRRTWQHINQAKKAGHNPKDVFHLSLKEFSENPPGSQIVAVNLGVSRVVPAHESLSKTEQLYISGKRTTVQAGGLNQINAHDDLRKRLEGVRRNLTLEFQDSDKKQPREMVVQPL